jgi:hypothetical protein
MSNTGFQLNGVDIINMFELIGVTNAGEDTGYKSSVYNKDLSNIFKKYTSGTYASDTGYKFKNTLGNELDISKQFEKKSVGAPLTISPAVTPTMIGSDYLYKLTSDTPYTAVKNYSVDVNYNITQMIYLVVAGGGGGGANIGAGGGAGGVVRGIFSNPPIDNYTMSIGVGGTGMINSNPSTAPGGNGGNSIIARGGTPIITAIGGGGGSGQIYSFPRRFAQASSGGSGAGATRWESGPGSGTLNQGNSGGQLYQMENSGAYTYAAGGGGGAGSIDDGGVGYNGWWQGGGNGGSGIQSNITGTNIYYGGGGGGSIQSNNGVFYAGNGGNGGGARAGTTYNVAGNGVNDFGGGGGGAHDNNGGNGGCGVIILRVIV